MIGQRFGRLIVNRLWGKDKNRNLLWVCDCDCGGSTIQRTNTLRMGRVKSCGCLQRDIARGKMLNEGNPMWAGDNVSLIALHEWVRERKPKPQVCECCKQNAPYELANISGKYKRDPSDYEWLCRKCHMIKDGRMERRKGNGQFERAGVCECRIDEPV